MDIAYKTKHVKAEQYGRKPNVWLLVRKASPSNEARRTIIHAAGLAASLEVTNCSTSVASDREID